MGASSRHAVALPGRHRPEGEEVTKPSSPRGLKRYVEWMTCGRRTGRTAYVLREWDLPAPLPGAEWAVDTKFNAAEELLKDPKLKATIAAALKNGVEITGTIELKVKQKPSLSLSADTRIIDVDLPTRIENALEFKWHLDGRPSSGNPRRNAVELSGFRTSIFCLHSGALGAEMVTGAAPWRYPRGGPIIIPIL